MGRKHRNVDDDVLYITLHYSVKVDAAKGLVGQYLFTLSMSDDSGRGTLYQFIGDIWIKYTISWCRAGK